jgi:hypothetical protein
LASFRKQMNETVTELSPKVFGLVE